MPWKSNCNRGRLCRYLTWVSMDETWSQVASASPSIISSSICIYVRSILVLSSSDWVSSQTRSISAKWKLQLSRYSTWVPMDERWSQVASTLVVNNFIFHCHQSYTIAAIDEDIWPVLADETWSQKHLQVFFPLNHFIFHIHLSLQLIRYWYHC